MFILPETDVTPEQSARVAGQPVLMYRTAADYNESTERYSGFPWADRVVRYDPTSVEARGLSRRR